MAHRINNNGSDWNNQQAAGRSSGAPTSYQPMYPGQQYQPQPQQVMSTPESADPWNWGWDESNGSAESSNNNPQGDPKWDWSIDSSTYQPQTSTSSSMNYPQHGNPQQGWPNHYPQQYPTYSHQVPNTLDVINDSFNPTSGVNESMYSHHMPVFQTVGKSYKQNVTPEHPQPLPYINNNSNQMGDQKQYLVGLPPASQQFYPGFQQHEMTFGGQLPGQQQIPNNMYLHSGVGENTSEEIKAVPPASNEEAHSEPQMNIHPVSVPDMSGLEAMRRGPRESDALSPQWSTESLPSQGSDEVTHTTDSSSSNAHSDHLGRAGRDDYSMHPTELLQHHSPPVAPQAFEKPPGLSSAASEVYFNNQPSDIQSLPPESVLSVSESSSIANSINSVAESIHSLSLNKVSTDVENVEVAPPELSENKPPLGPPPTAGGVSIPPPPMSGVSTGLKTSNPYAANKGGSLNHKYANKHGVFKPKEGTPSPDNVAYNKHSLPVTHTQGEGDGRPSASPSPLSGQESGQSLGLTLGQGTEQSSGQGPDQIPGQGHGQSPGPSFERASPRGRVPPPEDTANLETVPDNKERPDVSVTQRNSVSPGMRFQHPVGQNAPWTQQASLPENQEVYDDSPMGYLRDSEQEVDSAARNGLHQWHRSIPSESLHIPEETELDRVVPGQGEDTSSPASRVLQGSQSMAVSSANSNVEDIAQREVPGHQAAASSLSILPSPEPEHISSRAVPGRLMPNEDLVVPSSVGPAYLQRSVLGQNSSSEGQSQSSQGEAQDEIPPPGLSRMVPGESRGPEGQGANDALDEPRVVTGLAEESRTAGAAASNSFQPVPDEPRVVTGVAQEELDNNLGLASSPVSTTSLPSDGPETTDLDVQGPGSSGTLAQLPSERSETIGSDCVESFPTPLSDTVSRRDPDSQRRSADELDSAGGGGRDYYSPRDRESSHERMSEGRRYRDDRDRRHFDGDEREYERQEDNKSPRGRRYPYSRDSNRYEDQDYRQRRPYEEPLRHGRRYKQRDSDPDAEEYGSDRDVGDRDQKRPRDRNDRERVPPEKWYSNEEYDHYGSRSWQPRDEREYRDRDRPHERDRDRDRERDRERERYDRDRGRYHHEHDYRRHEDYYRQYEEYYGQRSRPSSRSGSRPDYEEDRRRDYPQGYGGYYYNPRMTYDEYYRYYLTWQQYMQQQQQQRLHAQPQPHPQPHMPHAQIAAMPEDRGSVHSGRSSTHEELTRHNLDRSNDHNVSVLEETTSSTTPQRFTPAKFSTAHIRGVFTSGGHLIKISPHYPLDGQAATVEIYSMDQFAVPPPQLRQFSGPLIKGVTHKKSVINFCMKKIKMIENTPDVAERDSLVLLWRLLLLLLRQNGTVVGTDIAELLLTNSLSEAKGNPLSAPSGGRPQASSPAASLSGASGTEAEEPTAPPKPNAEKQLSEEEVTNGFREFLLYGNSQEALEWAMKHGLWGHALFLASKMESRVYANVMTRFANGLTMNDPLQTLYQLMSGRIPAAVTCCADEKWGDWRPHLAMILSNSTNQPELDHKAIITLGDALAQRGCFYASQFCYLMAQIEFGFYKQKTARLVLLGSSDLKPFEEFANNEAIQMTEIYVYANQLGNPEFELPQFQAYKYLYAQRLLEAGMATEALQYMEVLAQTVTSRPSIYSIDFMQKVYNFGDQLKVRDVSYSPSNDGEYEDPPWLLHLQNVIDDCMSGAIQPDGPSYGSTSNLSLSEGESLQPPVMPDGMYNQGVWHQDQSHLQHYDQQQQQHQLQQEQLQQPQQQQQQPSEHEKAPSYGINLVDNQLMVQDQSSVGYSANIGFNASASNQQPAPTAWQSGDVQEHSSNVQREMENSGQQFWSPNQWDNQPNLSTSEQTDGPPQGSSTMYDYSQAIVNGHDGRGPHDQLSARTFDYYPQAADNLPMERLSGATEMTSAPTASAAPQLSAQSSAQHIAQPSATPRARPQPNSKPKAKTASKTASTGSSWFGGLWNKLALRPKNQMILPEDKEPKILWSAEKQRWINTEAEDEEECGELPPPPKAQLPVSNVIMPGPAPLATNGDAKQPPPSSQNMYKMNRARGSRANYVDVFGGVKNAASNVPATNLFPAVGAASTNMPSNLFVPAPVPTDENTPVDFLTSSSGMLADISGGAETSEDASGSPQQVYDSAPMMYDPSTVNQFSAQQNSTTAGKKRYPNQ